MNLTGQGYVHIDLGSDIRTTTSGVGMVPPAAYPSSQGQANAYVVGFPSNHSTAWQSYDTQSLAMPNGGVDNYTDHSNNFTQIRHSSDGVPVDYSRFPPFNWPFPGQYSECHAQASPQSSFAQLPPSSTSDCPLFSDSNTGSFGSSM